MELPVLFTKQAGRTLTLQCCTGIFFAIVQQRLGMAQLHVAAVAASDKCCIY